MKHLYSSISIIYLQREKVTAVTKREGNNSHKERRRQQSQREKATTVTKREGNSSHKERR